MSEKVSIVSKSYAIQQLLDHLCTLLAEHKWKDALTILPALLLHISDNQLCPFIWKAVHLVMIHMHVSKDEQINILQLMFKSEQNKYPVALEWFIGALQSTDHTCIENCFQFMKDYVVRNKFEKYPAALFEAYMALFFYMQWTTKYNELLKISDNEDFFGQSPDEKDHLDLGVKLLEKLNNSYVYFGKCNIYDNQTVNEGSQSVSNTNNIRNMCEWLLAPLLDLEEKLNRSQEGNEDLERRFGSSRLSGIEIVEQYCNTRQDHLPSLKLLYLYIVKFHPKLENKKLEVLKRICLLCPEEYLVLTYVEALLQNELGDLKNSLCIGNSSDDEDIILTLRMLNNQVDGSECLLSGKSILNFKECFAMLTSFIEYSQWHRSLKAWHLLVTILKYVHSSWTNCWNCKKCIKIRNYFEEHCLKLALWPILFWNFSHTPKLLTEQEIILLIYRAYSAFIFGYDVDIVSKINAIFQNQDNIKLSKEVCKFFKSQGQYSNTFASYMKEETSNRFLNADDYFTQDLQHKENENIKNKCSISKYPLNKKRKLSI